jgi:hypothetical protein
MTPDELVRRVRVVFGRRQSGVITGGDMSVRRQPARPRAQRQAENESYDKRARTTGLVQLSVVVPVEKVPVLKALAVEWRAEAWAMLETDLPTADQILQIHAVCRTLTTCHRSRGKEPALIQMSVRHQDLGYIDLEQKTLQPLDNPFGSRLSPMS